MPFPTISYPSATTFNPAPDPGSFVGDAATAYAAGLHFAQALKEYNLQQKRLEQAALKQQQDEADRAAFRKQTADNQYANEQRQLYNIGRPVTQEQIRGVNSGVPQPRELPPNEDGTPGGFGPPAADPSFRNSPGGMTLAPVQQPIDPNSIHYDSRMQAWSLHTPEEMEQIRRKPLPLDDTNSVVVGQLGEQLGLKPGTRIPFTSPLAAKVIAPQEETFIPANVPGTLSDALTKYGHDPKKPLTYKQALGIIETGLKSEAKDEKTQAPHYAPGTVNGKAGLFTIAPGENKAVQVEFPPGASPEKPIDPYQQMVNARIAMDHLDRQEAKAEGQKQAGIQRGAAAINKLQQEEDEAHKTRQLISAALEAQPNPDTGKIMIIDPTQKRGGGDTAAQVELTPERRKALQVQYDIASKTAEAKHEAKRKIIQAAGGDPGEPMKLDRAGKATTTTTTQQTAAPKGKLTDPKLAGQYLQKAGGNKEKARALASADGWEF